jgi:uncharacterized protein (DUF433 family)
MRARVDYPHVVLDEENRPLVAGTTMKVVELVVEQRAYGWSPEELHFQHPDLTLGQIHGALAYSWDHAEELDREVARQLQAIERGRSARDKRLPPSIARLREGRSG